jgi:signal peptidase I
MRASPFRSLLQLAVSVFVAAAIIHTWLVMGLVMPVTVAGSSMAPTLEGPRRMFRCDACQFEFPVGLDQLLDDDRAVCPHCGQTSARRCDRSDIRGDRLLIDRTAFALRQPRRWEVVVFRAPEDANQLFVKRIVGLPGETVAIRDGEVWINGERISRPDGVNYPTRFGDRDECRLNPTEYFVVGDNGAVSNDSRNWLSGPGVDAKLLVGKPLGVR